MSTRFFGLRRDPSSPYLGRTDLVSEPRSLTTQGFSSKNFKTQKDQRMERSDQRAERKPYSGPAEAIGGVRTKDKSYSPLQRMLNESAREQPWNCLERPLDDSVRGSVLHDKSAKAPKL
ncbi:hypothetical protein GJ744_003160 [Endocarpon pusillum]|uniref:Uncharacterized protein n=1 Tax=Endocarpon pusillum TaxID=364733 RepID=A0A8H7AS25_9EURO|nr:hypothetical protein GJ744_003160 [Endocarpon pusillum]